MTVRCPICHDPAPFIFWIDPTNPPVECPYNKAARQVTDCPHQMTQARRAAVWRKVCPDSFDANGQMLTGQLGHVVTAVAAAGYNPDTGKPKEPK